MVHRISGQRQAALEVLGSGHQLVYALSDFQDIHSIKVQEMTNSYNELYLLVPTADVAKSSTMLMNHLSDNKNITLDKEGIVAIATTYAKLREELLIAARKYTQEEEQNIINIAQSI